MLKDAAALSVWALGVSMRWWAWTLPAFKVTDGTPTLIFLVWCGSKILESLRIGTKVWPAQIIRTHCKCGILLFLICVICLGQLNLSTLPSCERESSRETVL